ncbi:MerR family transcriptional regulator [Neobacillus thermocopriae]|uniref:MerR family transcriptional regulator n=1 Tax=Neobacillus thermocopriae TaxID=1215031 RepID=UPI002E1FD4D2|nr:MerR family transcriptional regulator [Neobacillus thermocopriae]MED3625585.1 MerR family transcriptional regulator [Neobacillus thermocopriae]MED3712722.1 MerR family transcriptional regulator [Neobacillus thermocopriae]
MKEVSKKLNVAPGNIRQWEKDLPDYLNIPRSKQGARIYTINEINLLLEIKDMYSQKLSKDKIREILKRKKENGTAKEKETNSEVRTTHQTSSQVELLSKKTEVSVITESVPQAPVNEAIANANQFFEAMERYKDTFLNEVKEEIKAVVRKEVINEMKKEISNSSFRTIKTLQNSIYKSTENTKSELQELSDSIEKASHDTAEKLSYLSNNLKNISIETANEIYNLTKHLDDNSVKLTQYLDQTTNEISILTKEICKERDLINDNCEEFRHEIRQREVAFQQMLANFREVAAAKERKWWKFWA